MWESIWIYDLTWEGHSIVTRGNRGLVSRRGRFGITVILVRTSFRSVLRKRRRSWVWLVVICEGKEDDEATLSVLHSLLFHLCLRTNLPCSYRSLSFLSPFFLRVSNSIIAIDSSDFRIIILSAFPFFFNFLCCCHNR